MRRCLQRELRLQRRHLSSLLAESRRKRRYDKWVEATTSRTFLLPYSPECVEVEFSEVRGQNS
jgi:hypothetical protein